MSIDKKHPQATNVYTQCGLLLEEKKESFVSFADEAAGDSFNRKCKIVCTMGPACWYEEMLIKLIDQGMLRLVLIIMEA